ncbi:MAG: hypothetical protein ABFS35_01850 [Bacteroidota bacterium]
MDNRILRKFGFKNDQQGIMNRYIRESSGWDNHLKNTKEFIIQSAELKNKTSCIILGSGWLLDVPIVDLSYLFEKVTLIDIIHPAQIVHKINIYPNVEIIESDITGFIEPVYHFMKEAKKSKLNLHQIEAIHSDFWFNDIKNADFVVSVNILNQLDILICDYIKKFDVYSEQEITEFRKTIQQNHLNVLPKGKSCLITDYEELSMDENNKAIKNKPLVYIDLPKRDNSKKWQWNFDMSQSYNKNLNTVFEVIGMKI